MCVIYIILYMYSCMYSCRPIPVLTGLTGHPKKGLKY